MFQKLLTIPEITSMAEFLLTKANANWFSTEKLVGAGLWKTLEKPKVYLKGTPLLLFNWKVSTKF